MGFISPGHVWLILLLLIVVLIIWGPGKLPDVGAGMGRAIREFKKATSEVHDAVTNATTPEKPVETFKTSDGATATKPETTEEQKTTV